MPSGASGVSQFVGSKTLENNADIERLSANELTRRRALAKNAKVQLKSSLAHPAYPQVTSDRRGAPPARPHDLPARRSENYEEDPFGASDLEDSDDTTRELDPQNFRGRKARSLFHIKQESISLREFEQDSEPRNNLRVVDDAMHEYNIEYSDKLRDYPDEDGPQSNDIPYHEDGPALSAEALEVMKQQMSLCQDSEQFKNGEKLHSSRFGSSHFSSIMPLRSGRFTSAHASVPELHRQGEEMGYVNEAPQAIGAQWNNHLQTTTDYMDGNITDRNGTVDYLEKGNHGQLNSAEFATRNLASVKHGPGGSEKANDQFDASSLDSQPSGGSSQSTPSQRTPRAKESSKKLAKPSSQAEKRKKASLVLDYDETVLSGMKYSELKDQPFCNNPRLLDDGVPAALRDQEISLKDLLEGLKGSHVDDQKALFLHMPLDQWERAGDWFLERFNDLMLKIREARRVKRNISKLFEEELAVREEVVRGQSENIQEVFKKMKQGGEGVLEGKLP